jgi:tetratricopeptide (TPR) repeat protein
MNQVECFVVMPYGVKPFPDASGRSFDFEKVYRVLIQRAVREAGMVAVRSDERVSSAIIHSEMFRDLRDRKVVLADLSLDNPNVFYELGVRHVMNAGGTVLICRKGSVLPFDVKLSRVIFYDFDGTSLDWEELESVVKNLKVALIDAASGRADSPVHALLEHVLPEAGGRAASPSLMTGAEDMADAEPAAEFQQLVADAWRAQGRDVDALFEAQRTTVFGSRALAYLALATDPITETARRLANHLNDGQQYRLANRLYERLHAAGRLSRGSLLAYASSHSEAHPDLPGALRAIALAKEAMDRTALEHAADSDGIDAVVGSAECERRLAGLHQWRWQLSHTAADLDLSIDSFDRAIQANEKARTVGGLKHPGFLAQLRLKQLVMLRTREGALERPDRERHRDAIVAMVRLPGDDPKGVSYLGWFQALALADLGLADAALNKAVATLASDSALKLDPAHWEIGRRQYVLIRRFIEQFLPWLRNHSLIGQIAQCLQAGAAPR